LWQELLNFAAIVRAVNTWQFAPYSNLASMLQRSAPLGHDELIAALRHTFVISICFYLFVQPTRAS